MLLQEVAFPRKQEKKTNKSAVHGRSSISDALHYGVTAGALKTARSSQCCAKALTVQWGVGGGGKLCQTEEPEWRYRIISDGYLNDIPTEHV